MGAASHQAVAAVGKEPPRPNLAPVPKMLHDTEEPVHMRYPQTERPAGTLPETLGNHQG